MTDTPTLHAVILAGGKGERFWPLSTRTRPKQFLPLFGGRTLLAQAVDRLDGLVPSERIWVITRADLLDAARAAAPGLPPDHILGEPVGRDTAPAVALACALVQAREPHAVFAILTADHVIGNLDRFHATLREAAALARERQALVTIGIPPTAPSTGFGYIETGAVEAERDGVTFLRAQRFVEKPDAATARDYVASGRFFWNAGMFVWSAETLMDQFRRHAPGLAALADRLRPVATDPAALAAALAEAYPPLKPISIDYALMEKADLILTARSTFAWDDVGSWPALAAHLPADADGNTVIGDAVLCESSGNIVHARGAVALLGMKDCIVVEAEGVTMICPRDRAADLKKLVGAVRATGRHEDLL